MPARTSSAIPAFQRKLVAAGGVVLLHVAALWALQSGLLHRPAEMFVPVQIVTEIITPPVPRPAPPVATPEPPSKPTRAAEPHVPAHKTPPPPAPKPAAAPELPPAPNAPTGLAQPQPTPPPVAAAAAAAPAPAPAQATASVELPVSDADYLHNPKPAYPPTSRRLGEHGKVVLRVLIGVDGRAQDATVLESSGFARLDRAALEAARQWRYVPGKRGGVPEPMWVKVPIDFDLSE
ncbi:energy transducer TonB [Ramlibacter ginsenosidimutans]|uniref:Protein TonB n=1 Tax=Ramlibacter ginsenosidimutans TaxID=502333 RepID=A0A934WNC6_9BURK|nr:energy transducer TonB [Ramlibacter ginsenosidimutans]MBK6007413.1 energy transducer TonB [Ramlibacter ginsenosidimutans]